MSPNTSPQSRTPQPAPVGQWDRFTFSITRAAMVALLRVTTLRGVYLFAQAFGTLEWAVNYKRRRRFYRSLRKIMGRKPTLAEKLRQSRAFFMQTRCDKVFYLIFDALPREQAKSLLTIDPLDTFTDALAHQRGLCVAMAHQGPHHIIGMLLALQGYKSAGVRAENEGGIRKYVQDRLDRRYPEFARLKVMFATAFPREIYRCFKQGYIIGSSWDITRVHSDRQKTIDVYMFGQTRPILTGPLRIAIRCGTPILQAFHIAEPGFRYRLILCETLVPAGTVQDEQATIRDAVNRYAANAEAFLKENPSLVSRI